MSTRHLQVITVAATVALATFGAGAAAEVPPDGLLPEGIYRTGEVTRDELIATGVAAGFDEADVEAFVDADGIEETAQFGLRLVNGGWTQLYSYDGGPEGVGWRGTYGVIDADTVVATDPCGPITYEYHLDGDELTLDVLVSGCEEGGEMDLVAQTLFSETAPFIRVDTPEDSSGDSEPVTYASTSFVVPFEVTLPEWAAPVPAAEEPNFVTWESATTADRGIRFLAPVNVYPPGSATTTPLPDDYVAYLLSQEERGAIFDDVIETTIDGFPATIVTATVDDSLDGGLGCQAEELTVDVCFGLQSDLSLRLAVIEVGDQPLLIWVRDIRGVDAEYDTFDAMLASLHFPDATDTDQAAETIPDGTYVRVGTRADGETLGIDSELLDAFLGDDGEVPIAFEIAGDRWTHYVTSDAGIREVGDRGSAFYDDAGRWVTISEGGCRGCVIAFEWTHDDGTLTLVPFPGEGLGRELNPDELFFTQGTYEREEVGDSAAEEFASYASTSFVVPFDVVPPDWLPPGTSPTAERPYFVTWESTEPDRAVRFLVPAFVYPPGTTTATAVPDDYVDYLRAQADHGATFSDLVETTVDGHPATIVTATTSTFLDGSLGCEQEVVAGETVVGECWGLITDAVLRIAVIDAGDQTLLVWQRDPADVEAVDYEPFESMLASLHLRETAPTPEPSTGAPSASSEQGGVLEGTYRTDPITPEQAADALRNRGIDESTIESVMGGFGPRESTSYTLQFDGSQFIQLEERDGNPPAIGSRGSFEVADGDTVIFTETCCGPSELDYHLDGDRLTMQIAESDEDVQEACATDPGVCGGILVFESAPFIHVAEGAASTDTTATSAVTLRFASPSDEAPPQLVAFVEEVQRLSDGSIEFEWLPDYGSDSTAGYHDAEGTIVADLADSTVDIGWVGARQLPGFEALLAPLLVDSHDLQVEVFAAGIPARMLAELDEPGLVGITVLPGPLRRLAGVDHPFDAPPDFAGATIAGDYNALTQATFDALGATEVQGRSGLPLDDVDAVVAHFGAITGNGYHMQADSVVANVNLWPRPLAVVMSAESFAALSPEHQDILMTAGANAIEAAATASRDEDLGPGPELCAASIEVIEANEGELADLAAALQPVYDELAADPTIAAYLDEIRAIKEEVGAPPDTLTCPAAEPWQRGAED